MNRIRFTSKNFISYIFILLILFFMLTIIGRLFCTKILHMSFNDSSVSEQGADEQNTSKTDWQKLYPFSDKYTFNVSPVVTDTQSKSKEESNYEMRVDSVKNKIDYYSTNLLLGRMKFVEYNAMFNKAIGMNIITGTDTVLVMNNGYLTFRSAGVDTQQTAKSIKWFSDILEGKDINFLYAQYPSKENKFDNQLPYGVEDYNNQNADCLLSQLASLNVNTCDFRSLLNSEMTDYYSCFFMTDHHWKPETGVWAAGVLAKTLNKKFDYGIDESIGKIEKYNIDVYNNYCFGSEGKKVTTKFADPEDISVVYPKADTSFSAGYNVDKKVNGSFKESLIDMSVFDKIDYYNVSTYASYLYGNNALVTIHNNGVKNGKRILVIGDSFNGCVVPYLAQDVEYIDKLDLRYFNASTLSYIDSTKPDTVIVAYTSSMITGDVSRGSVYNFE